MPIRRQTSRAASLLSLCTVALTGLAACADAPLAPAAPLAAPSETPSRATTIATSTGTTAVSALLWAKPTTQVTASRVIGPAGGSVAIANGLKLVVPKGAVSRDVTFSVTRLPGRIVAYDFQPHGIRFAVPVELEHPTGGVDLASLSGATSIQGAYFEGPAALDQTGGTAVVSEFQPTFVSADKKMVKFSVQHFSGYMVSTGRRR